MTVLHFLEIRPVLGSKDGFSECNLTYLQWNIFQVLRILLIPCHASCVQCHRQDTKTITKNMWSGLPKNRHQLPWKLVKLRESIRTWRRQDDKVLLRQEKEKKLSTPYSLPLQLSRRLAILFLLRLLAGMQYRRNVSYVKKYFERDYDILPATSKSTDASEAQRATQRLSNQESREPVNVFFERANEDGLLHYTRSDDATMEQRDSVTLSPTRVQRLPSKFQDHVLGFIQLASE